MTAGTELFNGAADGTVISTSNTSVNAVTGSPEIDTAVTYLVGTAMRIPSSSTQIFVQWQSLAGTTQISASFYCLFASVAPTSQQVFCYIRNSAGTVLTGLGLSTAGRVVGVNSAGANITGTNIAAHTVSANNWYRIDMMATIGTSTTGRMQYRICNVNSADTDTPITTAFDSGATQNLGTTNIDRLYLGAVTAAARNGDYAFGIVRWNTASSSFFTKYPSITPVESTSGSSSDTSTVTASAAIDPIGPASTSSSDTSTITASSSITPAESSSASHSDTSTITATVDVQPVGASSATVSDTADIQAGDVVFDYVAQYRTTIGPGSWVPFTDPVSAVPAMIVDGLADGVSYDFRVAAVNAAGTGAWSGPVTVALDSGVHPIEASSSSSSDSASIASSASVDPAGVSSSSHCEKAGIARRNAVAGGHVRRSTVAASDRSSSTTGGRASTVKASSRTVEVVG